MSRLIHWIKTLGVIPLALVVIFMIFLPSILVAAGVVAIIDLLFLDLTWMSWPTFWWIAGVWAGTIIMALAANATEIMFGTPR